MKITTIVFSASLAVVGLTAPALAQSPADQQPQAQIVARNAAGHATMVRIDGQDYAVCTQQGQDGCIEPYAAGLNWGNRPLDYWPGQPASEMHGSAQDLGS